MKISLHKKITLFIAFCLCTGAFAQTTCNIYMDPAPLKRATSFEEMNIVDNNIQAVGQQYNTLNGTINAIRFWGRVNPAAGVATNQVRVRVYNVNQEKPNQIIAEKLVTLDSASQAYEVNVTLATPLTVSTKTIFTVEPFSPTTDNFFIRTNKQSDPNTGLGGDGQMTDLLKLKQGGLWYANQASNGYDFDALILPITTKTINSNFTQSITGSTVNFTNTTTNGNFYSWNFGDGNTSTQTSPSHIYSSPGTYTVTLKAYGADTSCFHQVSKSVTITNDPCAGVTIVADFTYVTNEKQVTFTNTSTGASTYLWNFGDGNTSTTTSPVHTYATDGTYNVKLKAYGTDVNCVDSTVVAVTVMSTGIRENGKKNTIEIGTNLVTDFLLFNMKEETTLIIYNTLGERVYTINGKQGENKLNVSSLKPGIYYLQSNTLSPVKFVKL